MVYLLVKLTAFMKPCNERCVLVYRPRRAVGWYWERRTRYEELWSVSHCESHSFQRNSKIPERSHYNAAEMGGRWLTKRDTESNRSWPLRGWIWSSSSVFSSYLKNFSIRRWRLWIQPSLAGWIDWALYEMRVSTDASYHTQTHVHKHDQKQQCTRQGWHWGMKT